ncbi:MAG: pitrilysin family protein [Bacteroidia bacterium]|nr:pitrilysin family protein [Bacteroidia bacterium]
MSQIQYTTFTLDNGLKVIIHEDHAIPKAVMNILYRVGARDEDEQRTGFAHLFEHLMFEGSRHIPRYDEPLQRVGGQNNAFTTNDITNYYLTLPSNQLETAFWLESDRMLELAFSQEKLDIQKSVVIEEYKQRYLNQPYGDAYIHLRDLHFQQHPYKWPTIGKEIRHIEEATLEDVERFFYGFYAPNNATMVIAGDVDPTEVRQLSEKWFGPIPSRSLSKHPLPQEPVQTAPRTRTVYGDVPFPAVYKMYHIPAHTDKAYYVADLLTDLLSSGKSSLLFQHLVRDRQVSSGASAFSWGAYDPGMISVDGRVADGVSVADYETALEEVFEQLRNISDDEITRIKSKLEASFIMQQTTLLNKAMSLAFSDALGDPDLVNTTPEIYQAITPEEVRAAAARYLAPENCSTLYYLPHPKA